MDMFILLTLLQMLSLNEAYNFTCPSQAHWNLRAKSMCNPERNYTCLFNVTFRVNVYNDTCNRPRLLGPGYKYVFQPNLNRATCSATRYQPFLFDTNGNSDCTYQKSLCNSLGQETYEDGNTTVDRLCICNTATGYSFVKNPKNQCYCDPSTEDCSCYLGINPYNQTIKMKDINCYDDIEMTGISYLGDRYNISRKIKIVEFDNYIYNVHYVPTNTFRIEAVKLIFMLSLAYIVVWIVVLRVMRRWSQVPITPKQFDIVECTDCSITVEWLSDVPDECLSYEINHQPIGTGDWSTEKFLSGEVSKQEDGRRMYTLQNLLPGINYELTIRSVYKDEVKSHISEPKTKHTLKLAPKQFNIVECTDSSITVEWLRNVPDDCLSYELNHQPLGTGDWSTKKFLSGEVSKQEDGRRMYTLQNLLPGINYELTIRSVYKDDVKSHMSEPKTNYTLKLAPKQFNIVECTDCSITVEWLNDVPDECLSYELNHQPLGTGDWSTKKIFAGEVSKQEDGRRMYTLEHLQAGTCYELKIRSVYKGDVKGHFSESKTKQTFQVFHLSEEDKINYNKLMQTSKKEKRYFVRVMIVGKESTGKTCLLRRLLKEDISDVTSTDGVDIVLRRCKINIEDGKWIIGKEIKDDKVSRMKRALTSNAEDTDFQNVQVDETNINISQNDEMSTDKKDTTSNTKDSQDESGYKNGSALLASPEDLTTDSSVNMDKNGDTNDSLSLVMSHDFTSDANVLEKKEEMKESSSLVMPDDLMSNVFSKSTDNTHSKLYALCELWDFAGQKEFYATHQAFLTSCAVYIVVADMKDDISKQGLSQCFADFQDIGEYVDFWFDSIHCHRTTDKPAKHEHFDPPILVVFTGKDKFDKADFKKREKELNDQMDQVLGFKSKYHHLHNKFYLSNTTDTDEEFEKLRYAIYESASKMDNWGDVFPLKWILLEHLIEINKNDGKNFINFNDFSKMAKHPDINIHKEDEILLFLRFQHNVGNIIFFENIRDLIILNPQWLADAFRCLVSDRFDNSNLHHREDWTMFIRQGKISGLLIVDLFELKTGGQFSGQKQSLYKVMEKLDILVKIENSSYYIMPSMMPSFTFNDVCAKFGINDGKCKKTSWLCFKFEFLPPSFFNHLSAWFIRNYKPSKVDNVTALYRGICMFDFDGSACEKILVTMSTDTIALQVVSFSAQEGFGSMCSGIYSKVKQLIGEIKEKYQVKIFSELHFKCSDGDYYKDTFEYNTLTKNQECFCPQHQTAHRSKQIYSPWMDTEVKEIPDRAKINTTQDDQNPENKPNKEVAHDQASAKTNLPVSVTLRQQLNIKKSKNENLIIISCIKTDNTLVFTDYNNTRLIICNSDGTDIHHIPLSFKPFDITEINSNTVAVSCEDRTIQIIDISTRSITSTINTSGHCWGMSYNDNNLYVVIDYSIIHVMDLTGKLIRTIPAPLGGIYDITVDRDRLVCIGRTSIYCCSLDGKLMWKFKMDEFQYLTCVTTDNEGNVYVINERTQTVIVVSDDGKHHRELLTESDGLDRPYGIYFDKKENVLVCNKMDGNAFLFDVIKKLT